MLLFEQGHICPLWGEIKHGNLPGRKSNASLPRTHQTISQSRPVQIRSEREGEGQETEPNVHPIDGVDPPKI